MFFDQGLIIFVIPAMLFALYAQGKVKSTYNKYSRVFAKKGFTGAQVARKLLDDMGLYDVDVELTGGHLTDHYDPRSKKVRLSREVYYGSSLAALSIAAHETGHANQHANGYFFLTFRNNFFPVAQIGSQMAMPLFFAGFLFGSGILMEVGIALFSFAVLFQIITLPIEFNASSRAMAMLSEAGFIYPDEEKGAKKVLDAAALTYVAATAVALAQILRLLLLRSRRD
ncbi:hypothetical protein SAMN02745227_00216 [Anaerobranca californiensis DSM 14826]|jgi:Zn-dependent membrane protease YugP|uniref:Zinc metallopeptidase n=1 Tax=Anaerobranca californiensis DSM 14826 TaxID=1120989 RepID=A0A1M6KQK7_9FIRM|nr:zinc metallopeptidase [Anaerobranca californiensis]SHJ61219.1 hypothetical protein SAMN02745227_00216 [Anaerobranca californiensis DSM 14826]